MVLLIKEIIQEYVCTELIGVNDYKDYIHGVITLGSFSILCIFLLVDTITFKKVSDKKDKSTNTEFNIKSEEIYEDLLNNDEKNKVQEYDIDDDEDDLVEINLY